MKSGLAPLLLVTLVSGCASIISGTTQDVSFHSNPEGATVTVDGNSLGKTPMTYPLAKSKYHTVTFAKDGYKPLILPMEHRLNGWFWGNIVFGGFIGSTTDGLSGAATEYSPNQFMISLEPLSASSVESETSKGAKQKAREFIVIAYSNIRTDLARGSGDYLHSLMGVLEVPPEQQLEARKRLNALAEAYGNIMDFADHAIELYMKSPGAAAIETAGPSWETVKSDSAKDQYFFLIKTDMDSAATDLKTLTQLQEDALTHYILHEKGRTYEIDHRFRMASGLSEEEKAFIRWYLKSRSGYEPI